MADKEFYDHELEFKDDLDLNKDMDFNDDFELPDDTLLLNEDANYDDEYHNQAPPIEPVNTTKPQGFGDFIKAYGFIILVVMVAGYFGLTYILGPSKKSSTVTPTQKEAKKLELPADAPGAMVIPTSTEGAAADKTTDTVTDTSTGPNEPVIPGMPATGSENTIVPPTPIVPSAGVELPAAVPAIPAGTSSSATTGDLDAKITAISQTIESMNNMLASQKDMTSTVDELKQQVASLSAKVSGPTDVNEIKDQINKTNLQNEQLLLYVQGVGKALSLLSEQVKKQEGVIASFVTNDIGKPTTKKSGQPGLLVEAVISGRAWLKTISGQAFSVAVGDKIPGYGKVVAIDSIKGELTTDSGTVLTQ